MLVTKKSDKIDALDALRCGRVVGVGQFHLTLYRHKVREVDPALVTRLADPVGRKDFAARTLDLQVPCDYSHIPELGAGAVNRFVPERPADYKGFDDEERSGPVEQRAADADLVEFDADAGVGDLVEGHVEKA